MTDSPLASGFIQARWGYPVRGVRPIWLVEHLMVSAVGAGEARACANYFATTTVQASAHYNCDPYEVWQSYREDGVAWHAPGANLLGIGVEVNGIPWRPDENPTPHTPQFWTDNPEGKLTLATNAKLLRDISLRRDIPLVPLSVAEASAHRPGVLDHWTATQAFGGTHWDVGNYYPWQAVVEMAAGADFGGVDKVSLPPGPWLLVKAFSEENGTVDGYAHLASDRNLPTKAEGGKSIKDYSLWAVDPDNPASWPAIPPYTVTFGWAIVHCATTPATPAGLRRWMGPEDTGQRAYTAVLAADGLGTDLLVRQWMGLEPHGAVPAGL